MITFALRSVWLTVFLCFSFVMCTDAIAEDTSARNSSPKNIVVGISHNPPIGLHGNGNEPSGLVVDIVNHLTEQNEWQITFDEDTWPNLLAKLERGDIDLLGGIAYSDKRAEKISYSKEPIASNWAIIYHAPNQKISNIPDLDGKRITSATTGAHTDAFNLIASKFGIKYTHVPANSREHILEMVSDGRADAGIVPRTFHIFYGQNYKAEPTDIIFNPIELYFATPKGGSSEILDIVDTYVLNGHGNPKSHFTKAAEKWLEKTSRSEFFPKWFAITLLATLGIISIFVVLTFWLQMQVKKRTADLVREKQNAEQASQAKSEFLASMSHELRTPMNAVLGFAQMLQYNPKVPLHPEQNKTVENIIEGGNHLLNLVNGILDLARIEAYQFTFALDEFDANKTVAECVDLTIPLAEERSISITNQFGTSASVKLLTDETRFKQVLINLLSNAIKYNKDGGKVIIDGHETTDDFLHISITDTGVGIAEKDIRGLFQMFHRLGVDPFKTKEGTGIGLTVVKQLVEKMGGRIGVKSEEGVGSTFWFEIPTALNKDVWIWTEAMRIGVDPIDKDHQVLITLLNKTADHSASMKEVKEIVGELIDYTRYHFKREEAVMIACGYPEVNQHREMHEQLLGQVNQMTTVLWNTSQPDEPRIKLHKFLRDWLFDHIINEDKKIVEYTKGRNEEIKQALEDIK